MPDESQPVKSCCQEEVMNKDGIFGKEVCKFGKRGLQICIP